MQNLEKTMIDMVNRNAECADLQRRLDAISAKRRRKHRFSFKKAVK